MGQRCAEQIPARSAGPSPAAYRPDRLAPKGPALARTLASSSWAGQAPAGLFLVPQKLVNAGLGAGALVDALDDHGAGGRGAGRTVLQRSRRQGAGHHNGIFRNLADKSLAGVAIDDLGRGPQK